MSSTALALNLPDDKEIEVRNHDNKFVFTAKQVDGKLLIGVKTAKRVVYIPYDEIPLLIKNSIEK